MQSVLQSAVVESGKVSSSLWSGMPPTLTPCMTKQQRLSEKEMKTTFGDFSSHHKYKTPATVSAVLNKAFLFPALNQLTGKNIF